MGAGGWHLSDLEARKDQEDFLLNYHTTALS